MTEWTESGEGVEIARHDSGAHFRIVQDAPDRWRASVRVRLPEPHWYGWLGPELCVTREEAIAWCEAQASKAGRR